MWSFSGKHHVSSFRTAKPSETFLQAMEQLLASDDTYHLGWTTTATGFRDALHEARPLRKSVGAIEEALLEFDGLDEEGVGKEGAEGMPLSKDALRRLKRQKRMKEVRQASCVGLTTT